MISQKYFSRKQPLFLWTPLNLLAMAVLGAYYFPSFWTVVLLVIFMWFLGFSWRINCFIFFLVALEILFLPPHPQRGTSAEELLHFPLELSLISDVTYTSSAWGRTYWLDSQSRRWTLLGRLAPFLKGDQLILHAAPSGRSCWSLEERTLWAFCPQLIEHKERSWFLLMRARLLQKIDFLLDEFPFAWRFWVSALILGQRDGLSFQEQELFRHAGVSHLLALSGTHLALFFILANRFVFAFLPRFYRGFATLFFVFPYLALVGFLPSLSRAFGVFFFLVLDELFYRYRRAFDALSLFILLVWVFQRQWLDDLAFQLSILAFAGLTYPSPLPALKYWQWFFLSWRVQLFTAPVLLFHFSSIAWIALLSLIPVTFLMTLFMQLSLLGLFLRVVWPWAFPFVLWGTHGVWLILKAVLLSFAHMPLMASYSAFWVSLILFVLWEGYLAKKHWQNGISSSSFST